MASSTEYVTSPRPKNYKLSYTLCAPGHHHRFGINATAIRPDTKELFTAGRDGTIRGWAAMDVSNISVNNQAAETATETNNTTTLPRSGSRPPLPSSTTTRQPLITTSPACICLLEEHVDWVNDILFLPSYPDRLISASSDTVVKIWDLKQRRSVHSFYYQHKDYIKALAMCKQGLFASAALDGRILVYDVNSLKVHSEITTVRKNEGGGVTDGISSSNPSDMPASIYCLDGVGTDLLASGSTSRTVSVWDVRTRGQVIQFKGHTDIVRAVKLAPPVTTGSSSSPYLLSGASDRTIRLWDMRQASRPIRVMEHHTDSVWALGVSAQFSYVVSGGRDGKLMYSVISPMNSSHSEPIKICENIEPEARDNMILSVTLLEDANSSSNAASPSSSSSSSLPTNAYIYASSNRSNVHLFGITLDSTPPRALSSLSSSTGSVRSTTSSQPGNANANVSAAAAAAAAAAAVVTLAQPHQSAPASAISTAPKSLISSAYIMALQGLPAILEFRILNTRKHVLTRDSDDLIELWNVTTAQREKSLGKGLNMDEVEAKLNEEVFIPSWFSVDLRLGSVAVKLEPSSAFNAEIYATDAGLTVDNEEIKVNLGEHVLRALFSRWRNAYFKQLAATDPKFEPQINALPVSSNGLNTLPSYEFPEEVSVIISEDRAPVPLSIIRRKLNQFSPGEEIYFPPWIMECVRDMKPMGKDIVKITFLLQPAEGSDLPPLTQNRLTAPRILRIRKVVSYVWKEIQRDYEAAAVKPGAASTVPAYIADLTEADLEIVCNQRILPLNMSLAAVRHFVWRAPEDLELAFRRRPGAVAGSHSDSNGVATPSTATNST